jgi:hypothetical protein
MISISTKPTARQFYTNNEDVPAANQRRTYMGDPAAQPLHLSGFVCRLDNTQSYPSRYGRSP